MPEIMYNVYIGHYEKTSDSKKDLKKLNDNNFKGYLFSMGNFYSLKVYTCYQEEQAKYVIDALNKKGFEPFYEVVNLKRH